LTTKSLASVVAGDKEAPSADEFELIYACLELASSVRNDDPNSRNPFEGCPGLEPFDTSKIRIDP